MYWTIQGLPDIAESSSNVAVMVSRNLVMTSILFFWRGRFLRVTSASGHEKDQPHPVHGRIIDIFARDFGQFSELHPLLRGTGVAVDTTDRCDFIDDVRGFVERIAFSNNSVWETRSSTRWMRDVANVLASGLQLARQRH